MGMFFFMGRIGTVVGGGGQDMVRLMIVVRGVGYIFVGNRGMFKYK